MIYSDFISPQTQFYQLTVPFQLESGEVLIGVQIAYRSWGELNAQGDNGVLICHALTGSADADDWWEPLFGSGKAFNPDRNFIVCSNILGSCYGTTGPTTINPTTRKPYGVSFPKITIRDMVRLQAVLLEYLGVQSLRFVIGGSLGGMQSLEWALLYPDKVKGIAPIAVSGRHSAWCIGLSEAQRQAIYADPNWQGGNYTLDTPPNQGLAVARMMAMSTYRSWDSFTTRFGRQYDPSEKFAIASYLQHQGQKLTERFDANTYITLTHAMDDHDIARDRTTPNLSDYESVLGSIQQPTLVVAIDSDILYPPVEQQELANLIPNAQLSWLKSTHGHDAFLIDMAALNEIIQQNHKFVLF
ncbi:homoserine O-acetyltransferase [Nostoc sp. ATCC 53789]|uniref:homoserine O-acetyltransferase MetX n=1 Tax=Nostoc sp. ATCC 53789 TaxID=76335 RepID=UPI000DECA73C|nr:homoserine O-acetyltransferase [Nostoc sp. ATCC 53789]QHG15729.1 homoserine O-acetyltransferase [Nostoc sp. ATCC 53789]RCJ22035.1 homoserine O-acetyltransferase [Nostoc sp. ATCC 53789]